MTTPAYDQIWKDSPAVLAVRNALNRLPALTSLPEPLDVREYVDPDLMSEANVEREFAGHEFPPSDYLGLDFKRRVLRNRHEYFSTRDQLQALDRFAEDAGFVYLGSDDRLTQVPPQYAPTWPASTSPAPSAHGDDPGWFVLAAGENAGARIGFRLCVSPEVGRTPSQGWVDFITGWVRWLFPRFRADVEHSGMSYPGVQVIICTLELWNLTLYMMPPLTVYSTTYRV